MVVIAMALPRTLKLSRTLEPEPDPSLMPMPIDMAHRLSERLTEVRQTGELDWVLPDGKTQVTIEYDGDRPVRVDTVVVSSQHRRGVDQAQIAADVRRAVIDPVVARYPVTLFVTVDCTPCDNARALLRQRGIPHAEKIVQSGDDADALQRLTGTRVVPTMMIGTQSVPGLDPQAWNGYLNAAGYPQQSMLPQGYQFAAPTPLQPRREAAQPATPNALEPLPAAEPLRNAAGIRF